MPVSLGDGPDFEHAALCELLNGAWEQGPHPLSIDHAVPSQSQLTLPTDQG
jgi:hypothetical protein